MTNFVGREGETGENALTTDGEYLYFSRQEGVGDIWVVDVVYK